MKYAQLGNTGLVVSRFAFGAMTFTAGNQDIRTIFKVGAQAADQLVGRALEAGVNFFDTADGYAGGESAWLLAREAVTSVLIGASKLSQLEDNLRAIDLTLTPKETAELDAVTTLAPVYPNWFNETLVDAAVRDAIARTAPVPGPAR